MKTNMKQTPAIKEITAKTLVGKSMSMSLIDNKTFNLFSDFMPIRNTISNIVSNDIFEVLVYNEAYFKNFNPNNTFVKWATVEVFNVEGLPNGTSQLNLKSGLYAMFTYKGLAKDIGALMTYIYSEWLPKSEYELDHRPHFNVLGAKYKNNHPESEETVWIPVKLRVRR